MSFGAGNELMWADMQTGSLRDELQHFTVSAVCRGFLRTSVISRAAVVTISGERCRFTLRGSAEYTPSTSVQMVMAPAWNSAARMVAL